VPEAIIAFLDGETVEEVLRLAISLGGDSDTIACMACSIAACCYPIPEEIAARCSALLTDDLREIMTDFLKIIN
jgi:ADP-ribosylglycohydrolase